MPEADSKAIEVEHRAEDPRDILTSKLTKAIALAHLFSMAACQMGTDSEQFHLGLEVLFDTLTDAEDARSALLSGGHQ